MPYACVSSGGGFKCITKGTGKVHGTHPDRKSCLKQLAALYANANPKSE